MDLSHITSQSLRRILTLTERKDELVELVAKLETEIAKVLSGVVPTAAKSPAKKSVPARGAGKRAASRKVKSSSLKTKILSVLESAGAGGLKVREIAGKVGSPAGNISVWFSTTGKKFTRKLAPGRYAVKGAKPAKARTPALPVTPASPAKVAPVAKAKKQGRKTVPLKARILSLLGAAGPKGMRVKDIAEKLGLPGGNVSVWFSTTGKKFTSKVEPGIYAVKTDKPAAPSPATPVPAPAKNAVKAKKVVRAGKPASPSKKAFKLPKAKGEK
ncbi:MAG: hypothetical protein WC076_05905 [Terrimicrobiaceae bacterium]|jgi:hypothetical protein